MSTEELKPCPFCGVELHGEIDDGARFHTHPKSDCWFSEWEFDQINIEQWNRRADPAAGTEKDAERLLTAIVRSDVGIATRHKLEDGQGTSTDDGRAWLAAIEFVAAIAAKEPPCSS
jgi:hypothetical protein